MTDTTLPTNWIADENKFKLETPPAWWLQRLYDFDHMLVVLPSRMKGPNKEHQYLLTRRRLYSVGLSDVAMLDNKHPDTNMCYVHGVLPIAPLRWKKGATKFTEATINALIADLKSRDTWAISGGPDGDPDKVWKAVEARENAQADKERADMRDGFYHRARDAWRSLQARAGWRNKRASDHHGVAAPVKVNDKRRVKLQPVGSGSAE